MELKTLFQLLEDYSQSDIYPMHMPGHKRNSGLLGDVLPYAADITEISGFDDLHAPSGVIKDLQESLKCFYKSRESFLLVGGSTCGIMAAIITCCSFGDKIIVARNCHRSVYKAIELYGLRPVWIMPQTDSATGICGEITDDSVRSAIKQNSDAKLVVITSPTYEGVISDIRSISKTCHSFDMPLLCDMAHGAHLPLFEGFDMACGADIAITSLHKTLPCLTQTACAGIYSDRISSYRFSQNLQIFESSSPSYVLMSSADRCMSLLKDRGNELAQQHAERIKRFQSEASKLKHLKLIGEEYRFYDSTKLVISCDNTSICGSELFGILRDKYKIECEMASARYIVALTSICDSDVGLSRLADAIVDIDSDLSHMQTKPFEPILMPACCCTAYEAIHSNNAFTPLNDCAGKVSGEYIVAYPPGIPIIAPGEIITQRALDMIAAMRKCGLKVQSSHIGGIETLVK